jgi:hypothetical protein
MARFAAPASSTGQRTVTELIISLKLLMARGRERAWSAGGVHQSLSAAKRAGDCIENRPRARGFRISVKQDVLVLVQSCSDFGASMRTDLAQDYWAVARNDLQPSPKDERFSPLDVNLEHRGPAKVRSQHNRRRRTTPRLIRSARVRSMMPATLPHALLGRTLTPSPAPASRALCWRL